MGRGGLSAPAWQRSAASETKSRCFLFTPETERFPFLAKRGEGNDE